MVTSALFTGLFLILVATVAGPLHVSKGLPLLVLKAQDPRDIHECNNVVVEVLQDDRVRQRYVAAQLS